MDLSTSAIDALRAFGLQSKTCIITGAASGIGRATAELFASTGARVAILDLNEGGARGVAADIVASGGDAIGLQCDISSEESVLRAFGVVADKWKQLDVLVNNAAYRIKHEFLEITMEQWDRCFAVTARGTFLCMRTAINQMRAAGKGGSIVNVSSVGSVHPTVLANAHYDMAKAGIDALTRIAALEFAADGIRINSIMPGGVKTRGLSNQQADAKWRGPATQPGRVPRGDFAEPVELARAILFVASSAASFMTGASVAVDGGFLVG